MIKISGYDSQLIDDIVKFRSDAYLNSGRDPTQSDAWSRDEFDSKATHVLMYNEEGQIIGAVRIIDVIPTNFPLSLRSGFQPCPHGRQSLFEFCLIDDAAHQQRVRECNQPVLWIGQV